MGKVGERGVRGEHDYHHIPIGVEKNTIIALKSLSLSHSGVLVFWYSGACRGLQLFAWFSTCFSRSPPPP